jgi:two-component system sensor histidine kinase HydH
MAVGLGDTAILHTLGVTFEINGRDGSWLVGAYFGLSFAVLGFLLVALMEGRRRDRRAAALIREQMHAINAVRARLVQSEKLAALGQLASAIAHEVRNPLGVIRSAAQTVSETLAANDDEGREACRFITAEIDRLNNVIASLLAFSRPLHLTSRPVAVSELFDRAVLLAGDDLASKRVRLHRDEPDGIALVEVDADLLSQVLLGLITNAVEALYDGGEIVLRARASDHEVEISVSDSGPGVPAELRARIFEPFFTTRSRGTGLGLAIARQIVEAHGGRIDVDESVSGGARFSLRLPAARHNAIAA